MEYVWIAGPSAIGKSTLANHLANPHNADLRERLDITEPAQLIGYAQSFEQLAAFDGSKTGLIIWQVAQDFIDEIAERMPAAKQRIMLVWRPFAMHSEGYKEKRLRCYPGNFSANTPEEEWVEALKYIRPTDSGYVLRHSAMQITVVDASDGYAVLPEWPKDE